MLSKFNESFKGCFEHDSSISHEFHMEIWSCNELFDWRKCFFGMRGMMGEWIVIGGFARRSCSSRSSGTLVEDDIAFENREDAIAELIAFDEKSGAGMVLIEFEAIE